MQIHPTAIIQEGARLGAGCVIHAYAIIDEHCELGEQVVVHPFAVLGGDPQDLSFAPGTASGVKIGPRTIIREHVTISRATKSGLSTQVGSDCYLMAGCHVAHDCRVGDRVIIANAVQLAGHVQIGDRAFLGGGAMFHQFCRVGESAMIGGAAEISRDIPPYTLVSGRDAIIGLNIVGLRRRGFKRDVIDQIKRAFQAVDKPTGDLRSMAAAALERGEFEGAEARVYLEFFAGGRRGFARTRRRAVTEQL